VCGPPEERNNENILVKGSYFMSTPGLGAHTVVFGYDTFNDIRIAENHQSGSDWRILGSTSIIRGTDIFPVFNNNGSTLIQWNPITQASLGTDYRMHSLFVNDTWRVSDRVTLNLGLRYDRNDGKHSADQPVVKDAAWSPRLSVTFDPTGSGVWAFNAGAGRYVAGVASSIADSSSAGGVSYTYQWEYLGPAINTNQSALTESLVTPDRALETLFAWFNANGATDRPLAAAQIPGVDTRIGDRLKSPSAWEYTAGVARQIGEHASVRADVVYRDYRDFYVNRRDLSTGQVQDSTGRALDLSIIENSNDLERQYVGLNLQASYRLGSRLVLGGNYTLSRTWGDIDGETLNNGPIPAGTVGGPLFYPEYVERSWGLPVGDLLTDQRHRGRIWATWLVPTSERFGSVTLAWFDRMASGTPYPALGLAAARGSIVDPGYASPPVTRNYYFSDRDAFHTEGVHNSDAAVNYDFRLPGLGGNTRAFASFHVLNVFNEAAVADVGNIDTTVLSARRGRTRCSRSIRSPRRPSKGRTGPRARSSDGRSAGSRISSRDSSGSRSGFVSDRSRGNAGQVSRGGAETRRLAKAKAESPKPKGQWPTLGLPPQIDGLPGAGCEWQADPAA
jgi:outer membrane receptor protein involved in Fe transport